MATIGVHGLDAESFLEQLRRADVRLLLDVRQRRGVGKRSREELAPAYVRHYTVEVLDHAPVDAIVDALPELGAAALLCVEREPLACHRSLVASRLADRYGVTVEHLVPDEGHADGGSTPA